MIVWNIDASGSETEAQNRNPVKKHQWIVEWDALLIDYVVELKNDPFWSVRKGNNFKSGFLLQLEKLMEEKLPRCGVKAQPHFHSRDKLLKTQY